MMFKTLYSLIYNIYMDKLFIRHHSNAMHFDNNFEFTRNRPIVGHSNERIENILILFNWSAVILHVHCSLSLSLLHHARSSFLTYLFFSLLFIPMQWLERLLVIIREKDQHYFGHPIPAPIPEWTNEWLQEISAAFGLRRSIENTVASDLAVVTTDHIDTLRLISVQLRLFSLCDADPRHSTRQAKIDYISKRSSMCVPADSSDCKLLLRSWFAK